MIYKSEIYWTYSYLIYGLSWLSSDFLIWKKIYTFHKVIMSQLIQQNFLSAYYMPVTTPGAWNASVNKKI